MWKLTFQILNNGHGEDMDLEFQIEYVETLVKNPMNNFMNPRLKNISYFHQDNNCLYYSLHVIEFLKMNVYYYSIDYLRLTHNECVARQKIQETNNSLSKFESQLTKAYGCAKEIQEIYPKLNIDYPITNLVGMQEESTILIKLAKLKNCPDNLIKALKLLETVKNKTKDKELYYLAIRNEAILRLDFAIKKINPINNCIKSIKLSEEARKHYGNEHKFYEPILQNQLNATLELETHESYGFMLENKKRIYKLLKRINGSESIDTIKLKLKSIDLGILPISNLDSISLDIQKIRNKVHFMSADYQKSLILEGEVLIKKAQHPKTPFESDANLALAVNLLKKYRDEKRFDDRYYEVQSIYKEAFARLLLFKNNNDENLLDIALNLLNEAKRFYEEKPFQNQIIHYPQVLYYLALTKKEIFMKNNSLKENHQEIEELLLKSINCFEKRNNYKQIVTSYFELGKIFYDLKIFKKAYTYLNKGIEFVETMRDSIINPNIKETFFNKLTDFYKLMINTCYNLNKTNETLKYVELTKQRLFLDKIILNQREHLIGTTVPHLVKKLNSIEEEILKISDKLDNFDKNNFIYSELYEQLLMTKKEQFNIISKIKKEDSTYYDNYFNNIHDYSKINLKDQTLIEYYYDEDSLFIFLVDKNQLIMKKVNFINKKLLFHRLKTIIFNTRNDFEDLNKFNNILSEFYDILIKPIKNNILNEKVLIIPYGQLHNVPFNGLHCEDYLINNYEITIVQSASLVKYLKNNYVKEDDDYLVIGNPTGDLVNSEREANEISNKLKTKPLIYEEANKENILNSMQNKKIIHFSGHGNFNIDNPMESSLELFDNDLYLKDLENSNINSELIVLSSCESGLTSISGLDENKGMVNYLQINGVRYVIAPLWSVIDEYTLELFKHFYPVENNYSTCLRNSQLILKDRYDIYKWGAFQIYGL